MRHRCNPLSLAGVFLMMIGSSGCTAPQEPRLGNLSGDAEQGRVLLGSYGCGTCHSIPDVAGATGRVGPPLWAMADRGYIAGVLPNTEEAMIRWIRDPLSITPRTAMPSLGVSESDARDMAAYLFSLRAEPLLLRIVRGHIERAWGRELARPAPPSTS